MLQVGKSETFPLLVLLLQVDQGASLRRVTLPASFAESSEALRVLPVFLFDEIFTRHVYG